MCPKGRRAGMTGSTSGGYPVPVNGMLMPCNDDHDDEDENFDIRFFHFTPLYL
jgi:hypothetical protein